MNGEQTLTVNSTATRIHSAGTAGSTLVFLHGGTPGVTPYCGGIHLWGAVLSQFATECRVVAIDLPGAGGTAIPGAGLTIDAMVDHVGATLDVLGITQCHLVGHDLGGLLALSLASRHAQRVRAVTAVASTAAAPTGDSVDNLTFAHPPAPLWSRGSQRWAFEQVSYAQQHINAELLDACVSASEGAAHRAASAWMASGARGDVFIPSLMAAKSRFYEVCRSEGMPVPTQVIWGTEDPLGTFDQGLWLYRLAAMHQGATQFHAINRAGALPFREQPEVFHQMVMAFGAGLAEA